MKQIKLLQLLDAPFNVIATYDDSSLEIFHKTSEIWKENAKHAKFKTNTKKRIQSIQIDGGIFMDADETSNKWVIKQ